MGNNKIMVKALRPSAIERLSKCSGSMRFLPSLGEEEETTSFARAGINAHLLLESMFKQLEGGVIPLAPPSASISLNGKDIIIPDEDIVAVNACIVRVNSLLVSLRESDPKTPIQFLIEQRIRIDVLAVIGTADLVIIQGKNAIVMDYKNGKTATSAVYQGLCYSVGALEMYDLEKVHFGVFQYGISERDVIEFQQPYTRNKLDKYNKVLKDLADKAMSDDATLVVGSHCLTTFCPALNICPKVNEIVRRASCEVPVDPKAPIDWEVYESTGVIKKYLTNIDERVKAFLEGTPEQKALANKYAERRLCKGNRAWIDPAKTMVKAEEAGLYDDLVATSLISMTAAKKLKIKGVKAFVEENTAAGADVYKVFKRNGKPQPLTKIEDTPGLPEDMLAVLQEIK